jgi:hypothetical protein
MKITHLVWIVAGCVVGFFASFIFGDLLSLRLDLYYLIYFGIILGFFAIYVRFTHLNLKTWFSRHLGWGILLGVIFAFIMVKNVLSRPATVQFSGGLLVWEVVWRGVIYGAIDGLLLTVFPWIVTWRAFQVETRPLLAKIGFGLLAWVLILVMTTAYHSGYSDFRSSKMLQANIGNTIMSVPTLLAANPLGAPIAHAALHVSAVIHSPHTELFLPPHREQPEQSAQNVL